MNSASTDKNRDYAAGSPLGRATVFDSAYDPGLLHPIARNEYRATLSNDEPGQIIYGEDIWNCYELSWLEPGGKPVARQGQLRISCDSPAIVESKSLKLYLNSLNQQPFASDQALRNTVEQDVSEKIGGAVEFILCGVDEMLSSKKLLRGECLDQLQLDCSVYQRDPAILTTVPERVVEDETLYSHLLRSICPVTGQPDWATLIIRYSGNRLDRDCLLQYIVSYRTHRGFHEQCVEQIFSDLWVQAQPDRLEVSACYTRRGGIDINPCRSSCSEYTKPPRIGRQ